MTELKSLKQRGCRPRGPYRGPRPTDEGQPARGLGAVARAARAARTYADRPRHSQLASSGADEYSAPVATRPKRVATMRIGNTKWHEVARTRGSAALGRPRVHAAFVAPDRPAALVGARAMPYLS